MQVELLYFDGCPNWQETAQRLREAMTPVVPRIAHRAGRRGRPLRRPGRPGGAVLSGVPYAGGLRGAPTVQQLVEALRPTRR